jgi:hypothetical protein
MVLTPWNFQAIASYSLLLMNLNVAMIWPVFPSPCAFPAKPLEAGEDFIFSPPVPLQHTE